MPAPSAAESCRPIIPYEPHQTNGALLSGPLPPKEMGVILGIAVLLDAGLVRLILLPLMLRLLGKWAWYLPKPLDKLLPNVRFGHA